MFGATPLPRTLEAALRDVGAAKPAVRAASLRDLVAHAGDARDRVIRALQRALRDDEAAPVRAVAATALADIGAREALPDLLLAVEDDDVLVRQMAIAALGELGDPRATERLRRALADERAEVRFQAVMAFPRVSASREASIEALLHATHDEDAFVCHIALRMTEEVRAGGPPDEHVVARARALLGHASVEVQVASAVLLAPLDGPYDGGSAPKPPAEGSHDGGSAPKPPVEGSHDGGSAPKLSVEGSPREAPSRALVTQVARGEVRTRDREDEAAAIELCGELGLERAQASLEKRAFGRLLGLRRDPLAWHARVALARMGHERAGREILREIGASDRDVCTLAVAAAGRAHLTAARDRILALRGQESRADPHAVDEALAALADAALTNPGAAGSASSSPAPTATHDGSSAPQPPSTVPPATSRA